jgi:hypothetical protein
MLDIKIKIHKDAKIIFTNLKDRARSFNGLVTVKDHHLRPFRRQKAFFTSVYLA